MPVLGIVATQISATVELMATSGGALLGTIVPLALVVAASPLSIVPAVLLVLHSPRPRPTGLAFLLGWFAALAVVVAAFVQVPHLLSGLNESSPQWFSWVRIVLGALLIGAGVWRWATRKQAESATWLTRISTITPPGAAALGAVLVGVNPKVLLACAAAGLAIGTGELTAPMEALAIACYTAVAGSTAAAPILAYAVAAERIDPTLERVKAGIERHQAAITAVILVLIGVALLFTGLRAL